MPDLAWTLPPSPDHKLYREIIAEIELVERKDPVEAMLMFRAVAEADFWFFNWQVTSTGEFRIKDRGHRSFGKLWIREPFLFDLCRQVQEVIEKRTNNVLISCFRHSFKTNILTKNGTLWILARDPLETVSIHTHKVDQVGENMGRDLKSEVEKNEELRRHWPQYRNCQELSDTRIVLDRPLGPKDPSISVHPILGSTASMHPTRIIVDDAIVDRIAASADLMSQVDQQLKNLVALRGDDTAMVFVGTPWGPNDPLVRREKDGFFNAIVRKPAHVDGVAQLRSEAFFREQRRSMRDDFLYLAQYELQVVQRGDRYFRDEWLEYYKEPPRERAKGLHIYIVVDVAGGGDGSDSTVVRVFGIDWRKHRYNLDLWIEKAGLNDLSDLLFGCDPKTHHLPEHSWKPKEGLVNRWHAVDRQLEVWIEEFGAMAWTQALKNAAARAKKDGLLLRMPQIRSIPGKTGVQSRKKSRRISLLQAAYRQGEIWYPAYETDKRGRVVAGGFGHGSHRGKGGEPDDRDTLVQFQEDEYRIWTMEYGDTKDAVDNSLDTEAWPEQPELKKLLRYPVKAENVIEMKAHIVNRDSGHSIGRESVSWQAY